MTRSRGNAVSKSQMVEVMLKALLSDAGGDPARPRGLQRQQPKPATTTPWHHGKPAASKCVACFLQHHSPKATVCRACANLLIPIGDAKCPGAAKVHKQDRPAKPAKPATTPAAPAADTPSSPPATGAPTTVPPQDGQDSAVVKPIVSIPPTIAKYKLAAESFVHSANNPPEPSVDLVMGDGSLFPSAEETMLQAQVELFATNGAQPNAEVHAVLVKQLAAARDRARTAKETTYTLQMHLTARKAINGHKEWLLKQLAAEENAILEAEAALAVRKEKLGVLQADMAEWISKAEDAMTKASVLLEPPVEAATAATVLPATTEPVHVAHEMGRALESSRAERASKLALHQSTMGRPLTMEEIFDYTENLATMHTVTALASVNLTVTPPTATAVPQDVHDLDLM